MRVNVLYHASCFDGVASSSIFSAFYRGCVDEHVELLFTPKQHRPGDPFAPGDFDADETAIVDFRYSKDPGLTWYFDHHVSAFQLDGEREHFEQDESGKKYHDDKAPSCTGYIARIAAQQFGFDPTAHAELLHWAELIDTASFPNPSMPVRLEEPALRLMTFVEQNRESALASRLIEELLERPLTELAEADYVKSVLDPALARHEADIELMRQRCKVDGTVGEYALLDQPPRAYNKFIPYYLHPDIRYLVGLSKGPDGRIKLSAGYNPWLPPDDREHDIARLCEKMGGGGHPYVGGVSFDAGHSQPALDAKAWMASVLRGDAS